MFGDAYEIASEFTFPVAISRRAWTGKSTSGIGTFIVLNDEGWVLTAGHIIKQILTLHAEVIASRTHEAALEAIDADLSTEDRKKHIEKRKLVAPKHDSTRAYSVLWGPLQTAVASTVHYLEGSDIGVALLQNFDKSHVQRYPKLKDPSKNYRHGTSLCRLGFPFHALVPTWDEATKAFTIDSWPPPLFPIEGIFTRVAVCPPETNGMVLPYPTKWLETSSPGLKGQSGGPIVDALGDVWAVQCVTQHLSLGFDPPVPLSKKKEKVHQFLNVGYGVHMETVIGFLSNLGIKYELSTK